MEPFFSPPWMSLVVICDAVQVIYTALKRYQLHPFPFDFVAIHSSSVILSIRGNVSSLV